MVSSGPGNLTACMRGIRPQPQYLTDDRVKTDPQMVAVRASVTEMAGRGDANAHCSERLSSSQRQSTKKRKKIKNTCKNTC